MRFDPAQLSILPVCVFSLVIHECAHGLAALACGDPTAGERGRLTLRPLPHPAPIGSLPVPSRLLASPLTSGFVLRPLRGCVHACLALFGVPHVGLAS